MDGLPYNYDPDQLRQMRAYEGFLRRTALVDAPFMLKGSYVTRQYFTDPADRIPGDLDWVYLEPLADSEEAARRFTEWMITVTETELNDGVRFQSFRKNAFWRSIDYAMADDFPTVNTNLDCWIDEEKEGFNLDISFNLDVPQPPVPLHYRPLSGEPFDLPATAPIALQVAWKIHQTLVRTRFKDLFDLVHLLRHPHFDAAARTVMLQALVNECHADKLPAQKIAAFFQQSWAGFYPTRDLEANWYRWRYERLDYSRTGWQVVEYGRARSITNPAHLPETLAGFQEWVAGALKNAGLGPEVLAKLPAPTRGSRKGPQPQ